MILFIKLFFVGLLLTNAGAVSLAQGLFPGATVLAAPATPTKLPDFEFANLNGGALKSAEMKGKVIVIRFWATW